MQPHVNTCVEKNTHSTRAVFRVLVVHYSIFEFKVTQAEPYPTLRSCYVQRRGVAGRRKELVAV